MGSKSTHAQAATVVLAKRELGASFADAMPMTVKIVKVFRDDSAGVGRPRVYFKQAHVVLTKRNDCDVSQAIQKELGVHFQGARPNKIGQ